MGKKITYRARWRKETRDFWNRVNDLYGFEGENVDVLYGTCENLDAFYQARAELEDGMTFTTKSGQIKAHPAASIAKNCWAGFLAGLRALEIEDDAPKPKVGRPLRGIR